NKPLTNSLNTKNSKPQKLTKNPKKIQESKTISKIGISIIASVLLSQNLVAANLPKNALPSGGKFVGGSSGSIKVKVNDKVMNITGNNTNHIIAWGGGFNIGKDAEVNFNTSHGRQASFLNLDYTNKASQILGKLNGNNHNIYLVNPSGVLIEQGASVNANRFVASTSSLDKALKDFTKNAPDDKNVATFSPVFSPNEVRGNIVNMGNITAGNIILVGKEVRNRTYVNGGDRNGVLGNFNHTGSLKIVGNKIFLDAEGVTKKSNIELMGFNDVLNNIADIKVQMAMSTFRDKIYTDNWIKQTYTKDGANPITNIGSIYNIITIGATNGWNDFATAWNSNSGMTRQIEEFKLIKDINFNNGDFKSVGKGTGFNKIFNGNGYTMLNIKLTDSNISAEGSTAIVGIFNKVGGGTIKDLTINGVSADISAYMDTLHLGAFAGQINGGNISNVTVNNIDLKGKMTKNYTGSLMSDNGYVGGFAGVINKGNISNVALNNISKLYLHSNQYTGSTLFVGGFAGRIANASGTINNVILNEIGTLQADVLTGKAVNSHVGVAGFTAELGSNNIIRNADLYYTEKSKLMPAVNIDNNLDSRHQVGSFYVYPDVNSGMTSTLEKINIYYNIMVTDDTTRREVLDEGYGKDGNTYQDVRLFYTAKGMIEGIQRFTNGEKADNKYKGKIDFQSYPSTSNDSGFQSLVTGKYPGVKVDNKGNYSWVKQERISNTYDMSVGRNTSSDYQTLINTYLPQIIDDILEADYGVTIENENGTSTQDSLKNIMAELDKILKVISDRENEKDADGKITNFLNQILVGNDKNNAELKESIKQSINFLRAFYDGYDNGSKQNAVTNNKNIFNSFANNTNYKNATEKYSNTIKGGMTNLKNTISGQLDSIKTLENTLKDLNNALEQEKVLDGDIANLQNEVKNINKEIEKLNEKIAGFGTDIASLDKEIAKFGITLEALDNEIANLKAEIANTKDAINKIPRPEHKEALKKELAKLEAQLAEKEPKREELNGFVTTKNELQAALDKRNEWKAKGEEVIAQIETEKGKLTALKNKADGYVTTINGIRDGFKQEPLKINQAQNIELMAGADTGSFTFRGVIDDKTHDITDKVEIPSIIETPAPQPKPEQPKPEPEQPKPEQPEQPEQPKPEKPKPEQPEQPKPEKPKPEQPEQPEIDNPDNGGNNGGGDNGNNGGDNGDNNYEGDDTVNNESGYDPRLAYLNYKREVLELPAEEETSIEINEGREKGRLCIVSDNAKTNNPCMAITY
ncbi:filamentous hemagglutinin N-terminal domain-containing protein, partial [Helicobacter pullorum]|uniref:filamentous hemagglutinin N-terminal domain-containing protein n=1 Tax=Helicobacter pullorum TaxID=35818 RepID=UPI00081682C1